MIENKGGEDGEVLSADLPRGSGQPQCKRKVRKKLGESQSKDRWLPGDCLAEQVRAEERCSGSTQQVWATRATRIGDTDARVDSWREEEHNNKY